MNLEFHLTKARLRDLIWGSVEQVIQVRGIGLNGFLDNVPFFTDLGQLYGRAALPATVAVDHFRLTEVLISPGTTSRLTSINVPPAIVFPFSGPGAPGSIPDSESAMIEVQPSRIRATFEIHIVRINDLRAANGDAIPAAHTMVVQLRANFVVPPPTLAGSALAIAPIAEDLDLGAYGLFVVLGPLGDYDLLPPADRLALFRARNGTVVAPLDDTALTGLLDLMLRLNGPVLGSLAIPPISFNVSGIEAVLASLPGPDGALRLWNAGLFVGDTRVVVRLQAEPTGLRELAFFGSRPLRERWSRDWVAFYGSGSTDRIGAGDWSLFLPSEVFLGNLHKSIVDGVAASPDILLSAGGAPSSEWRIVGGTPDAGTPCSAGSRVQVITRFAVFVPRACVPWGLGIDVNVRLTISLSLTPSGKLRADVHLDFAPDEGDLAICSILNSHLAAAVGFIAGGALGGYLGAAIGAAVGGLAGGIVTLAFGFTYHPGPLPLGGALQPVPGSDRDFFAEYPLAAYPSLSSGRIEVGEMAACPDGLCVRGAVGVSLLELVLAGDLAGAPSLEWWSAGLCIDPSLTTPSGLLEWPLERSRPGSPRMPLALFQVSTLDAWPATQRDFVPTVTVENYSNLMLKLTTDAERAIDLTREITEGGFVAPFVEIFLQTNVGARIVRWVPFDGTLTRATFDDFALRQRQICAVTELARRTRRDPHTLRSLLERRSVELRPTVQPRKGARTLSLWTVAANELKAGDVLRVGRTAAPQRAAAGVRTASPVVVESFHELEVSGDTIVARLAEDGHKSDSRLAIELVTESSHGLLTLAWEYFHETARIGFGGALRDVAMERADGSLYLALLSSLGLDVYDCETAEPRLVFSRLLAGGERLSWGHGALAVEGVGAAYLYTPATCRLVAAPVEARPAVELFARRQYSVLDIRNRSFTFIPFGRRALVVDAKQSYVSYFELQDRKTAERLDQAS